MASTKDRINRALIGFEQGVSIKTVEQLRAQTRARFAPLGNPKIAFSEKKDQKASSILKIDSLPTDPGSGNYNLIVTSSNGNILKIRAADGLNSTGKITVNDYGSSNNFWNSGGFSIFPGTGPEVKFVLDMTTAQPAYDSASNEPSTPSTNASTITRDRVYEIVTPADVDSVFTSLGSPQNEAGIQFKASANGPVRPEDAVERVKEVRRTTALFYKIGLSGISNESRIEGQRRIIANRIFDAISLAFDNKHLDIKPTFSETSPFEIDLKQERKGSFGNKSIIKLSPDPGNSRNVSNTLTIAGMSGGLSSFPRTLNGKASGNAEIIFTGVPTEGQITIASGDGLKKTFTLAESGGLVELTGTIDPAASTAVTGVGTLFESELSVGDRILVSGETRTVASIVSNTQLTVHSAFSNNANDLNPKVFRGEVPIDKIAAGKALIKSIQDSFLVSSGQITVSDEANAVSTSSSFKFNVSSVPEGRSGSPFVISTLNNVTVTGGSFNFRMHSDDPTAFALGLFDSLDPIFRREQAEEFLSQRIKRVTFDVNNIINSAIATYQIKSTIVADDTLMLTQTDAAGKSLTGETGMLSPVSLTGTINPAASTSVTGVGTKFTSEILVGENIIVSGETRTVNSISNDTSLTVSKAFSNNPNDVSPKVLKTPRVIQEGLSTGARDRKFTLSNWRLIAKDHVGNFFLDVPANSRVFESKSRTLTISLSSSVISRIVTNAHKANLGNSATSASKRLFSVTFTNRIQESALRRTRLTNAIQANKIIDAEEDAGFDLSKGSDAEKIQIFPFKDATDKPFRFETRGKTLNVFINISNVIVPINESAEIPKAITTFYQNLKPAFKYLDGIYGVNFELIESSNSFKIKFTENDRLTSFNLVINNNRKYDLSNMYNNGDVNSLDVNFQGENSKFYFLKPNHAAEIRSFGFGKKVNSRNAFDDLSLNGPRRFAATGSIDVLETSGWLDTINFQLQDSTRAESKGPVHSDIPESRVPAVIPSFVTFTCNTSASSASKTNDSNYVFGISGASTTEAIAVRIKEAIDLAKNDANTKLGIEASVNENRVILRQMTGGVIGNTVIPTNAGSLVNILGFSEEGFSYSKTLAIDPTVFLTDTGDIRFPIQENNFGLLLGTELDGIIEPLEIRLAGIDRMVTERPLYGIKGAMAGSYNYSDIHFSAEVISNEITYENTKIIPFKDVHPTVGQEMGLSAIEANQKKSLLDIIYVKTPGFIFKNDRTIYPFIDTEERIKQALPLEANNPDNVFNDQLVAEVFELGNPVNLLKTDSRNLGGENYRRSAGFDFSTNTHPGTDSIVFGGLTYV